MLAWLPDPVAIGLAAGLCVLFIRGLRSARSSNRPFSSALSRRPVVFGAGIVVFLAAFTLPGYSIFPQMIEHVLLAFAVPPLFLLGVPKPVLLPIFEHRRPRHLLRALTRPGRSAALFLVILFLWYAPGLFELTLASEAIRMGAGLSILAAAILFWWPVIEPFPAWDQELADLGKLLYLFVGSSVLKVLGFILAIAPRPIYRLPAFDQPAWGLTRLADQQDAGWLMVCAGTFVLLGAATVVCIRMFQEPDDIAETVPDRKRDLGMRG